MADNLVYGDVAALMIVLAGVIEVLDTQQPGVKKVLAETLQEAADQFPDQESPRSIKATLRTFQQVLEKPQPLGSLFH